MYNYFCTSRAAAPVTIRAWNRLTRTRETLVFIPAARRSILECIAQRTPTQQTCGLCDCDNGAAMHGQERVSV
jgi:hypothetical protein